MPEQVGHDDIVIAGTAFFVIAGTDRQSLRDTRCPSRSGMTALQVGYDGDSSYTVIRSENSKLAEGDRFRTESFMISYPLYIPRHFPQPLPLTGYSYSNQ